MERRWYYTNDFFKTETKQYFTTRKSVYMKKKTSVT